ncbi:MAG: metallophosphoesterase [Myxococcales bacterium]|nr:metallophosphoesterase [Myxococcales bacterium]
MRFLVPAILLVSASASAATIHGLVYEDANRDGKPSAGEAGIAHAVVAFGVSSFVETDASGQFDITVTDGTKGIVWVRVPDGYRPGPVWQSWQGTGEIDLGLRRLASPVRGPLTFVVAADTHLHSAQQYFGSEDLATVAAAATAIDPAPAFFTILGDVTQGNQDAEFDLVDKALAGLDAPWVPVPGNHDWYDGGAHWFRHYGPDNYSFDLGDVHFVVWNMAMTEPEIRTYLGAELARVAPGITIVALTHAPPSPDVVDALRSLGVDYVLTGHAHSNRIVDHDGVIELNTEPLLMGGLDFTPAGYRVITIDHGKLTSYHRTSVEAPYLSVMAPVRGECAHDRTSLLVATELDAGSTAVTARIDCATPIALRWTGGWTWSADLPPLAPGAHAVVIEAASQTGARAEVVARFEVCDPGPLPASAEDWTQLGGNAAHLGARAHEIAPPLVARWTVAAGGDVLHASPSIADGVVYVVTTDLADGDAGAVVAIDLATGRERWKVVTPKPIRGGVAVVGEAAKWIVAAQIDGVILAIDPASGAIKWRYELSAGIEPAAGALFASPSADAGEAIVGHQRAVAALGPTGAPLWTMVPVPKGLDSQSAAAIAIADGIAVGTFNRALGGVLAWDRATGGELWRVAGDEIVAINASPVIAGDSVYVVTGADEVIALELATGLVRWHTKLDPAGFDWGNATIGTPATAHDVLVVPTLYRDLVAVDTTTGVELWRHAASPSPLRTTHYRGAREAGFAASPVITGDVVWAADTAGTLSALELRTGALLWRTEVGAPVLAGLAATGDWLVVASYDGTVRAYGPDLRERVPSDPPSCREPVATAGGCCDAGGSPSGALMVLIAAVVRRRRRA